MFLTSTRKRVVGPAALAGWSLPTAEDHAPDQLIELCQGTIAQTETPANDRALARARPALPWTCVAENIGLYSGGPYALAVLPLSQLTGCVVTADVFHSVTGDRAFGKHADMWVSRSSSDSRAPSAGCSGQIRPAKRRRSP